MSFEAVLAAFVLCPFCDESWPPNPPPRLISTLKTIWSETWPAPRPNNPEGRGASLERSINVCSIHRAATGTIPAGIARGYPQVVNFIQVQQRVASKTVRDHLLDLTSGKGDRGSFWVRTKHDFEENGLRRAQSAQGQYQTFAASQVG